MQSGLGVVVTTSGAGAFGAVNAIGASRFTRAGRATANGECRTHRGVHNNPS